MTEKIKDWKFIRMSKPFLYVASRPYFREVPKHPLLPEAMTQTKGDRIKDLVGEELELKFDASQPFSFAPIPPDEKYSLFTSEPVELIRAERIPFCGEGKGSEYEVFDWVYQFMFKRKYDEKVSEEDGLKDSERICRLFRFEDSYCDSDHALKHATVHWGTQSWKGLTMDIIHDGQRLFRDDVDVFTTKKPKLTDIIIVGAHSHKPDLLMKFREEGK